MTAFVVDTNVAIVANERETDVDACRNAAGARVSGGGIPGQCLQERPRRPRAERRTLDQELEAVPDRTA